MPTSRIVHIATHGLLYEKKSLNAYIPGAISLSADDGMHSTYFFSLLAIQAFLKAEVIIGSDGYLWADDVQFMALSKVQLVVLSACRVRLPR